MTKLTESEIELHVIELFKKLGYQYLYGPEIAPNQNGTGVIYNTLIKN